jgi:hypothetical protein
MFFSFPASIFPLREPSGIHSGLWYVLTAKHGPASLHPRDLRDPRRPRVSRHHVGDDTSVGDKREFIDHSLLGAVLNLQQKCRSQAHILPRSSQAARQ